MNLFCLLCIPLIYFLRKPASARAGSAVWALPLGGLIAIAQYFIGPLFAPSGFGFSLWLGGFIDIAALPVLLPIAVCLLFTMLRIVPSSVDYASFTLLWLIPLAIIRSMNSLSSPIPLVLVPSLWIAQAVGIHFFINKIVNNPRLSVRIPSVMAVIALPIIATTSWWAFFAQRTLPGLILLLVGIVPAAISIIADCMRGVHTPPQQIEEEATDGQESNL
ncbi:MAG: hypothetical protein LBI06_05375 [Treponema sp.]|jgi:hypothetical protein|nr:hypothetical protein [Treponema sp.]